MIKNTLIDYEDGEEGKKIFLEKMRYTFWHIKEHLTLLEMGINSNDSIIEMISFMTISKIIIFFEQLWDELSDENED